MTQQTHRRHVDDTRTVLSLQLKQDDENGTAQVVNLAGATVSFRMVDSKGSVIVADSTSRVTVTDAANGKIDVDFESGDVDEVGEFFGYIKVLASGESDTFPTVKQDLKIYVYGD